MVQKKLKTPKWAPLKYLQYYKILTNFIEQLFKKIEKTCARGGKPSALAPPNPQKISNDHSSLPANLLQKYRKILSLASIVPEK